MRVPGPQEAEQGQARRAHGTIELSGIVGTVLEAPTAVRLLMPDEPVQSEIDCLFAELCASAGSGERGAGSGITSAEKSLDIDGLFFAAARFAGLGGRGFAAPFPLFEGGPSCATHRIAIDHRQRR